MKNPKRQDATFTIRLYQKELDAIKTAANKLGKSLSAYVKEACLARAKRA